MLVFIAVAIARGNNGAKDGFDLTSDPALSNGLKKLAFSYDLCCFFRFVFFIVVNRNVI